MMPKGIAANECAERRTFLRPVGVTWCERVFDVNTKKPSDYLELKHTYLYKINITT